MQLHQELQDMYCLESINLVGNPVCNMNPDLANISANEAQVQQALSRYFGSGSQAQIPSLAKTET